MPSEWLLLEEMQASAEFKKLSKPAGTRWGSIQAMFLCLKQSEDILRDIVQDENWISTGTPALCRERMHIMLIIGSTQFGPNLRKALAILKPIQHLIVKYQSDSVPISEVLPDFQGLSTAFTKIRNSSIIDDHELAYLLSLVTTRGQFMHGKGHALANLLDPRFRGSAYDEVTQNSKLIILTRTPIEDKQVVTDETEVIIYDEYMDFHRVAAEDESSKSVRFRSLQKKSPLLYWKDEGCRWPTIAKIAIKLFTMATSSASVERNFSSMGFVHTKARNRMQQPKVEKVVFIRDNANALLKTVEEVPDIVIDGDCDGDDDDNEINEEGWSEELEEVEEEHDEEDKE
jgi:hAT family C-terminal dimerisation region